MSATIIDFIIMDLMICANGYWQEKEYFHITHTNNQNGELYVCQMKMSSTVSELPVKELISMKHIYISNRYAKVKVNALLYFYFRKELINFTEYRRILFVNFNEQNVPLLFLQIVPPVKPLIDWKWNFLLSKKLWQMIETECLMSWLSTLGGGFSALGEKFSKYAQIAGKISLKQLNFGIYLGDPILQARCKLFYSLSLIQTGQLRAASRILREQYAFALKYKDVDHRLINMCKGIWSKLRYERKLLDKMRS